MKNVRLSRTAVKSLARLDAGDRKRIVACIERLAGDWTGLDIKRLKGRQDWRMRVGDYRVIFDDDGLIVDVTWIGHRRDAY